MSASWKCYSLHISICAMPWCCWELCVYPQWFSSFQEGLENRSHASTDSCTSEAQSYVLAAEDSNNVPVCIKSFYITELSKFICCASPTDILHVLSVLYVHCSTVENSALLIWHVSLFQMTPSVGRSHHSHGNHSSASNSHTSVADEFNDTHVSSQRNTFQSYLAKFRSKSVTSQILFLYRVYFYILDNLALVISICVLCRWHFRQSDLITVMAVSPVNQIPRHQKQRSVILRRWALFVSSCV